MWSHEYTRRTPASSEAVWAVLRDVAAWQEWNDGVESIALDGPVAVGTTFTMTPPGEDPLVSRIAELEEGRVITDVTELGDVVVRVAHRVRAEAGGGTTVSYAVEVTASSEELAEEVGRGVSADFPQVLAALAARAEGRDRA